MNNVFCPYAFVCKDTDDCSHAVPHELHNDGGCTMDDESMKCYGIHGGTCLSIDTIMSLKYNKIISKKRSKYIAKLSIKRLMNE